MDTLTLEDLIRQYVQIPEKQNSRGFYPVLCQVCGDHGRKGKRAGFKFDTPNVGYNCFNCGHSASYKPYEHDSMPYNMGVVLRAYGIPESDWNQVVFRALAERNGGESHTPRLTPLNLEPTKLELPPYFYQLSDDQSDDVALCAIDYLKSRGVDWKCQPFYLAKPTSHPDAKRWFGRLIIPVYKDGELIFWQGRDLSGLHTKKYMSVNVARDNVLYGYDQLSRQCDEPLYIVEGWFDAYHLSGVAVYGNRMTENQIRIISRSYRKKVVIPDRYGDGKLLAEQAIELGWGVATPDIGSCKDVDEAVGRYGKMYTTMSILQNTWTDSFEARVRLGVYCELSTKEKNQLSKTPQQSRF